MAPGTPQSGSSPIRASFDGVSFDEKLTAIADASRDPEYSLGSAEVQQLCELIREAVLQNEWCRREVLHRPSDAKDLERQLRERTLQLEEALRAKERLQLELARALAQLEALQSTGGQAARESRGRSTGSASRWQMSRNRDGSPRAVPLGTRTPSPATLQVFPLLGSGRVLAAPERTPSEVHVFDPTEWRPGASLRVAVQERSVSPRSRGPALSPEALSQCSAPAKGCKSPKEKALPGQLFYVPSSSMTAGAATAPAPVLRASEASTRGPAPQVRQLPGQVLEVSVVGTYSPKVSSSRLVPMSKLKVLPQSPLLGQRIVFAVPVAPAR